MKKILIIIGAVVVVVCVIVVVVMFLTKGMVQSANQFFSLIEKGEIKEAYLTTSKEFQAATSFDQFKNFLEKSSIDRFEKASWSSRSIEKGIAKLEGTVKTEDGGVIPLKVQLVKENGTWRILYIKKTEAGLVEEKSEEPEDLAEERKAKEVEPGEKEIPGDAQIREMTEISLISLSQAINRDDFSKFYSSISELWQSQTNKEELRDAFKVFIEKEVNLSIIRNQNPTYSEEPYLNSDERLVLKGYYATKPYSVHFQLKYIYEHPNWKLWGIHVNTEKPE